MDGTNGGKNGNSPGDKNKSHRDRMRDANNNNGGGGGGGYGNLP